MAESEKSLHPPPVSDEEMEDGEIDDDDEEPDECLKAEKNSFVPDASVSETLKSVEKLPSPQKKTELEPHNKKASKDKNNQDEEDFATSVEHAIANALKKEGVEPPLPSIKKYHELEPEPERRQNRNNRKRKKRKDQKREKSIKKRSKLSENDGYYMVGGSPDQSGSDSDDTSYSSYDSEEYQRSSYADRRNKRRDKYGSNRDKNAAKERRTRDHHDREVCLRFAEYGHCPDDDCTRVHEVRQPKKMELCKFYLMECCAKKDKCSYMHGDFPCKYYYLGLKCINKDCKFMHGKPLTDNLKQILLKHLDTAPKEILGDFPRIGRENASKMISQTHVKLCQEFNVALPEPEKNSSGNKIPSLLEMHIRPPDFKGDSSSKKSNVRWSQSEVRSSSRDSPQRHHAQSSTLSMAQDQINEPACPGDILLAELHDILTTKQIENMANIGITTVDHINNLKVAQLNDLGLSLSSIGDIQTMALEMLKKTSAEEDEKNSIKSTLEDVDLRETPGAEEQKEHQLSNPGQDVDMRVLPLAGSSATESAKSPDAIMSPNQSDVDESAYKMPATPHHQNAAAFMSPPSAVDYSQYLRDSNLNNEDEQEEEPGLRIDETYCTSDYENEEKKDSHSEDDQHPQEDLIPPVFEIPLLPPSFDTSSFLKSTPILAKVDISSSVSQLMEKQVTKISENQSPSRDPRTRDPRMTQKTSPASSASKDSNQKNPDIISSPTHRDPRNKPEVPRRSSIYEIESPSEDEDVIKIDRDKDMRLPFMRGSENGDIDFRFPFTPISNYVPATEIEASYGAHMFEKYEVKVIDVPKPDYSEIKRSFRQSESSQDPRIKKLCGNQQDESSKTGLANFLPIDPRKRKDLTKEQSESLNQSTSGGTKKLQISAILTNSKHYNELSSSQKMVVNQMLAELSQELKRFHAETSPNKIFDSTFITMRPKLQQILIGLKVFVNAEGEFEEINDLPMVSLPNIHQMPPMMSSLNSMLQQPPPNMLPASMMNAPPPGFNIQRPGLLGLAPNLSQQFSNLINQAPPFGDQHSFQRDFSSNQSNRNNRNFRNNNQQSRGFQRSNNNNQQQNRNRRN